MVSAVLSLDLGSVENAYLHLDLPHTQQKHSMMWWYVTMKPAVIGDHGASKPTCLLGTKIPHWHYKQSLQSFLTGSQIWFPSDQSPWIFFWGVPLSNFWKIACWRNTVHWPMPSTLHVSRVVHRQRIRSVLVVAGVPHLCWSGPSSPPPRLAKALRRRLFKQETTSCFIVTSIKHEMAV